MHILLFPVLFSFTLFLATPALAQKGEEEELEFIEIIDIVESEESQDIMVLPPAPEADDTNKVHMAVERMPEYPGGEAELLKYMATVPYPAEAIKKNIEGKAFIKFVVEKNGSVSNVEVARSANELLDAAAVAHIKQMPLWKPGREGNTPVRVQYIIPVVFKLK